MDPNVSLGAMNAENVEGIGAPQAQFEDDAFVGELPAGALGDTDVPQKPKKAGKHVRQEEWLGTLLAGIPLLGFLIFGVIPIVLAFAMGFLDFKDSLGWSFSGAKWAGFDNFVYVITDTKFWKSVANTLIFGSSTFISLILALIVAYLMSRDIKGKAIWRVIYFIPYVCSTIALTHMWKYMFNPQYGLINQMLGNTDLSAGAINWLGDPGPFYGMVIIMSVWSGMAYSILLYTAALTNLNQSMVEAAKIDGAGPFRVFFRIVFPTLSPTTFYLLVTGVIGMLQAFATTFALGSSLTDESRTIVYYMYDYMMASDHLGWAGAAAWILAIIILLVSVFQFIFSKRWVKYD